MRLDFFLLADSVELGENSKLTIRGAEVTRVSGAALPVTVGRLAGVSVFLLDASDVGTQPTIAVKGWNPDGDMLFRTEYVSPPPEALVADDLSEGEEPRLSFVLQLDGLQFHMPGGHRIDVELNDEVVGSRVLAVVIEPTSEPETEPISRTDQPD